jgi:hypothetical protein
VLAGVPLVIAAVGWGLSRGDGPAHGGAPPLPVEPAAIGAAAPVGPTARAVTTVTTVTTVTAAPAEDLPAKEAGRMAPPQPASAKDPPSRFEPVARPRSGSSQAHLAPAVPGGARASCSDRSIFTASICLRTACAKPEFSQDADCQELKAADRRHRETMQRY